MGRSQVGPKQRYPPRRTPANTCLNLSSVVAMTSVFDLRWKLARAPWSWSTIPVEIALNSIETDDGVWVLCSIVDHRAAGSGGGPSRKRGAFLGLWRIP